MWGNEWIFDNHFEIYLVLNLDKILNISVPAQLGHLYKKKKNITYPDFPGEPRKPQLKKKQLIN